MSETDDTDELILIPPDFFVADDLEEPYLSGPYYNVVDGLISQVNHLENRLNLIETKSDFTNSASNSLGYPADTTERLELMSGIRKYNSSDDINKVIRNGYSESTQSTPQKPQTRFKLGSSTSSERYSPQKRKLFSPTWASNVNVDKLKDNNRNYEHRNEATKQVLQEIDQYICNIQSSKETDNRGFDSDGLSKNSLNLRDLDHMLRKVDQQTKGFEEIFNKNATRQNETNFESNAPSTSLHAKNRNEDRDVNQIPSTTDVSTCNESYNEKTDSVTSSSESTQATTLPNVNRLPAGGDYYFGQMVTKVSSTHVSQPTNRCPGSRRNVPQERPQEYRNVKQDANLLSLSNLWSCRKEPQTCMTREQRILQKLEEEKLRRQHCERIIQQLQSKTLELQERLAVAVQVDEAKDDAILRFHSSWEQVAERLQALTKERNDLEEEVANMQAVHAENMLDTTKKINHFEAETAKAQAEAQACQDKMKDLESQINEMSAEIHALNSTLEVLESDNKNGNEKIKSLQHQLNQKVMELNEKNISLGMIRSEVSNSKKAIDLCQRELATLRCRSSNLESAVSEKEEMIQSMERHNKKLLSDMDTHKKIEKDLQQELHKAKEANEKTKTDLRNFYQDQVEVVVRDKLKEFQAQLDKAEASMQEELKKRELAIAKSAAKHIQQIADKHSLEIKLLEEKHAEEVRLYQMKLSEATQLIEHLQAKVNCQHQKKQEMAKQLHRVMEAQWLEALKIINNGRSPTVPCCDQDVTMNQLNVLKTKSYSNLEEVLFMDTGDDPCGRGDNAKCGSNNNVPPLSLGASCSSVQDDNCFPYCANMETPLTSRPKTKQQIEVELQKYVHLLLNKQPGIPIDEPCSRKDSCAQEIPTWMPVKEDEKSKGRDKRCKKPWR